MRGVGAVVRAGPSRDASLKARIPRGWTSLAAAVLGGVATFVAFPPVGFWPLAAVGPALLVVAVVGRSWRAAFGLGAVFGVAFFGPLLSWLVNLGVLPWLALVVLQSLFVGAHGVLVRLLLRWRSWPVTVALSWVAVEALRSWVPLGGFPWGRLGFSQADSPTLPWVRWGGVPLLTLLSAAVGTIILFALLRPRRRVRAAVLALAAVIVWLSAGWLPAGESSGRATTVAVVQGNVPRGRSLAEQVRVRQVTANHADATRELAADVRAGRVPAPDFVVWPENSTDTDPRYDPEIGSTIAVAVRDIGRPVLIGTILYDRESGRMFNAGQLWLPDRGPGDDYRKRQLVPFGEYIPARSLFGWVEQLQLVPRDFTAGDGSGVLDVAGTKIGDVICYEVAYDELVASSVDGGAELLVVQTNNATYMRDGQTGETLQQLAMARVRAVEFDRSAVVASTTGVSAVIRPDGSLVTATEPWRQQVLVERVELRTGTTPAGWVAWWLDRAALVVMFAVVVLVATRRFRARAAVPRRTG